MSGEKWELFYTYNTPNQTIEERVDYFIVRDLIKLSKQKNPDGDIIEEIIYLNKKEIIEKLRTKKILWDKDMAVVWMYFANKK